MSGDYSWWTDDLPTRPGVYLFRDDAGQVLYVGKARSLKARIQSYRRPGGDGRLGVRFLQRDATRLETIVTRTEGEALLLEDTLIKQHKPPHNVRLKDDKSFLMLRVDLEHEFPRLQFVRAHNPQQGKGKGRSRLIGPFASSRAVRRTLSDLHRVVPLRDCTDATLANRSRPCLKHQIGLCSAPCVGLIDAPAYGELVERAIRILTGDTAELESDLDQRMRTAAEELEFERAARWRDRLAALRRTVEGQGVRPSDGIDRDVLGLARDGDLAVVHRLAFRGGRLAESKPRFFHSELPDEELLHVVLTALHGPGMAKKESLKRLAGAAEIVLPCTPEEPEWLTEILGAKLVVPRSGERRRMLDIATENAFTELDKRGKRGEDDARLLAEVQSLCGLESPPEVIDCFDISNLQGTSVVASRVRFRGGRKDRSGYRHFKVKTVEGQDDFASMKEVVGRSLKRGMGEEDLPDLVVIDGGAVQLKTALEARDEAGAWGVAMVSLAKARSERYVAGKRKDKSEERVYLTPDSEPIELNPRSPVRHLFERVRDEAHRFAIQFHRKTRGRITSKLDSIPGIGATRRKRMLRTFGSVAGVAQASVEELAALEGFTLDLAKRVVEHLAKPAE
ncbi:MAG: excinuclease ABC subunit UvrC [Planctomycetota bacterium]|nr:excinuclease ABC subunit UvrC [Planctomycetota bacterium]